MARGTALRAEVMEALGPHFCSGTQEPWDALFLGHGQRRRAEPTWG